MCTANIIQIAPADCILQVGSQTAHAHVEHRIVADLRVSRQSGMAVSKPIQQSFFSPAHFVVRSSILLSPTHHSSRG